MKSFNSAADLIKSFFKYLVLKRKEEDFEE
jgi:hypothetical protein